MSTKLFSLRAVMHDGSRLAVTAWEGERSFPYAETGHTRIDVRVRLDGKTIFEKGQTYCGVSRYTSLDGKAAKELVLSLIAMRPGDTDSDYFDGYTDAQLDFADAYADEICMLKEERYGKSWKFPTRIYCENPECASCYDSDSHVTCADCWEAIHDIDGHDNERCEETCSVCAKLISAEESALKHTRGDLYVFASDLNHAEYVAACRMASVGVLTVGDSVRHPHWITT